MIDMIKKARCAGNFGRCLRPGVFSLERRDLNVERSFTLHSLSIPIAKLRTGRGKRLLARTSRRLPLPAGEDARLQTTCRLPLTTHHGRPAEPSPAPDSAHSAVRLPLPYSLTALTPTSGRNARVPDSPPLTIHHLPLTSSLPPELLFRSIFVWTSNKTRDMINKSVFRERFKTVQSVRFLRFPCI